MEISIDSDVNPKTKNLICDAIEFYLGRLLPEKVYDELFIDVEFDSSQYEDGICFPEKDELGNPVFWNPRHFTLFLKNKRKNLIEVLAHECVHVKQFALNELIIFGYQVSDQPVNRIDLWKSSEWVAGNDEDHRFDSPWEIEAYGREYGLARRFRNSRGKK